jgi:hypothetical protein
MDWTWTGKMYWEMGAARKINRKEYQFILADRSIFASQSDKPVKV